ncbi:heterokaryon incompatibility protein-domain-containing protein [Daldinia sp. FL1419]|nr:heterokaryon incompatibility protein-domain-containing protein [Daldinia sp. FL1419]
MATRNPESFSYPSLPEGKGAIRLLDLQPGDFFSPIVCVLTSATFKSRPRYLALSYTWDEPYRSDAGVATTLPPVSDNNNRKEIDMIVNGHAFTARNNLKVAMQHIRSDTVSLPLWVDAVCINQDDDAEKSSQVAMMSCIYRRAIAVVAWIGPKDNTTVARSTEWRSSQAQKFALGVSSVLSGRKASDMNVRSSFGPDKKSFTRISKSAYWQRLWVVQEVCCPLQLIFMYGSSIWTDNDLRQSEAFKEENSAFQQSRECLTDELREMLTLLEIREQRHGPIMRLESLIECCVRKECSEIRDKIYGLLGLATDGHDSSAVDQPPDPAGRHTGPLDSQELILPEQSSNKRPEVDYKRHLYDIWSDVIRYIYFQVKESNIPSNLILGNLGTGTSEGGTSSNRIERCVTLVRTSGIIQEALGQRVEREVVHLSIPRSWVVKSPPIVRAMGFLSSTILRLGPELESFIESPQVEQEWQNCYNDCYKGRDLQYMKKIGENYIARVMEYDDSQLSRIQKIQHPDIIAWPAAITRPRTNDPKYVAEYANIWEANHENRDRGPVIELGPTICLGTNHLIALVPSIAKPGDIIIRFWGCNAAVVMRPIATELSETAVQGVIGSESVSYMMIGRADVARNEELYHEGGHRDYEPVYIDLDLGSLQMITASISTSSAMGV